MKVLLSPGVNYANTDLNTKERVNVHYVPTSVSEYSYLHIDILHINI